MVFSHHVLCMYRTRTYWNGRLATIVLGSAHSTNTIEHWYEYGTRSQYTYVAIFSSSHVQCMLSRGNEKMLPCVYVLHSYWAVTKMCGKSPNKTNSEFHQLNTHTKLESWTGRYFRMVEIVFWSFRRSTFIRNFAIVWRLLTWKICRESFNQVFNWHLIHDHSDAWLTYGSKLCICSVFELIWIFFISLFVIIYMIPIGASEKNKLNVCVLGLL